MKIPRPGQHRDCEQPGADDPKSKYDEYEPARDRAQCLGSLCGCFDVGEPLGMQGSGSRNDDEKGDDVGKCHAQHGVDPDSLKFLSGLPRARCRGFRFADLIVGSLISLYIIKEALQILHNATEAVAPAKQNGTTD
jgi:hypothetical protein